MKIAFEKIKRFGRLLRGLFPSRLPTGDREFEKWANNIISTYRMPTEHRDSILWALANIIAHLGPTDAFKPNVYFALVLGASASKQVAHAVGQGVRMREKAAAAKAAEERKQSEATDKPELSVVGPQGI